MEGPATSATVMQGHPGGSQDTKDAATQEAPRRHPGRIVRHRVAGHFLRTWEMTLFDFLRTLTSIAVLLFDVMFECGLKNRRAILIIRFFWGNAGQQGGFWGSEMGVEVFGKPRNHAY